MTPQIQFELDALTNKATLSGVEGSIDNENDVDNIDGDDKVVSNENDVETTIVDDTIDFSQCCGPLYVQDVFDLNAYYLFL